MTIEQRVAELERTVETQSEVLRLIHEVLGASNKQNHAFNERLEQIDVTLLSHAFKLTLLKLTADFSKAI